MLALAVLAFGAATVINYTSLEFDGACDALRAASFGDALSWATSARVKFLYGQWARPLLDEHHYVIVPMHSLLVWLSYKLHGLTLTGLRFPAFLLITLGKLLICYWAYRELGKRFLVAALVLLALYFPLNEHTRISNPESIQMGVILLSMLALHQAEARRNQWLFYLSGALLGLAYFYKSTIFILPAYPLVYFGVKRWLLADPQPVFAKKSGLFQAYAGFILVSLLYFLAWVIPNLPELYWLYARGHYTNYYGWDLLLSRLRDPLMLTDDVAHFYTQANTLWLAALALWGGLVILLERRHLVRTDVIFFAYCLVMTVQLSYTDPSSRRALTLLPIGYWALLRLAHLVSLGRSLRFQARPGIVRQVLVVLACYLAFSALVGVFRDSGSFAAAAGLALVVGLLLVHLLDARPWWGLVLTALLLAPGLPGAARHSLSYFTSNTGTIKNNSLEMGRVAGQGRVFGGYLYQLYNRCQANYVSTWTTNLLPDGFSAARAEHMTMPEFAKKYRLWNWTLPDIFRSVVISRFYPEHYQRWELPPDYRSVYHSDVFIIPPPSAVTVADRYLLVGAKEPTVYVTQAFYEGFLKPYANQIPVLGPALLTFQVMPATPDQPFTSDTLHKVLGWVANPEPPDHK
ncbi:MAG: ArnT family glycosyltransferase [Thermodesulfobacteriota bacterium]